MGRIAKLLSFVRTDRGGDKLSEVKIDPGGGENITCEHFASPGDDSRPLTTDFVITTDIERSGGESVVGYIDPINAGVAAEGEKRIYARDPADGSIKAVIWLKSDGSININNDNGSIELAANGNAIINGVTITPAGAITGVTSLEVSGVEVKDHNHTQANDSGGNTEQPTGPMI